MILTNIQVFNYLKTNELIQICSPGIFKIMPNSQDCNNQYKIQWIFEPPVRIKYKNCKYIIKKSPLYTIPYNNTTFTNIDPFKINKNNNDKDVNVYPKTADIFFDSNDNTYVTITINYQKYNFIRLANYSNTTFQLNSYDSLFIVCTDKDIQLECFQPFIENYNKQFNIEDKEIFDISKYDIEKTDFIKKTSTRNFYKPFTISILMLCKCISFFIVANVLIYLLIIYHKPKTINTE